MDRKEIGGYIELDSFHGKMLHDDAIKVNTARNALRLLIRFRNIRKIVLPYYLCDSVSDGCESEGVHVSYYEVDESLKPIGVQLEADQWLYLVNYFGQLEDSYIDYIKKTHKRIILDNVQAYYYTPSDGIDAVYSCRKYFGLVDGGLLRADGVNAEAYPMDVSFDRMRFILGRYELGANQFYSEYVDNNELMGKEPIKQMSKLTENMLKGIDYEFVRKTRENNYARLHSQLHKINRLQIHTVIGPFAYPLFVDDGMNLRQKLISKKIYVPLLWPNVLNEDVESHIAKDLAQNIIPLPCDQRYEESDMDFIVKTIYDSIKE